VAAHIHTPLTPPNHVVPEVSQATSDVLVKAMAKLPADRFASYDEMYMALYAARSQYLVNYYKQQSFEDNPIVKAISGKTSWWRR
jgi:hypothetical protein